MKLLCPLRDKRPHNCHCHRQSQCSWLQKSPVSCLWDVENFACGVSSQLFHPLGSDTVPLAGMMPDITGKHSCLCLIVKGHSPVPQSGQAWVCFVASLCKELIETNLLGIQQPKVVWKWKKKNLHDQTVIKMQKKMTEKGGRKPSKEKGDERNAFRWSLAKKWLLTSFHSHFSCAIRNRNLLVTRSFFPLQHRFSLPSLLCSKWSTSCAGRGREFYLCPVFLGYEGTEPIKLI